MLHLQVRLDPDEPSADVQAPLGDDLAAVEQDQVGGPAADVQIDRCAGVVHAVLKGAAALARKDGFQVRTRRGYHKLAREVTELGEDLRCVLLAGRLAGDNDSSGVYVPAVIARQAVFPLHQVPDGGTVDQHRRFERRQVDLAFVNDLFLHDGDLGDRKISAGVFHLDPAENDLGRRGSDVDAYAQNTGHVLTSRWRKKQ